MNIGYNSIALDFFSTQLACYFINYALMNIFILT